MFQERSKNVKIFQEFPPKPGAVYPLPSTTGSAYIGYPKNSPLFRKVRVGSEGELYTLASQPTTHLLPDTYDFLHFSYCYYLFTTVVISLFLFFVYIFVTAYLETREPVFETRGFSRAQTGDLVTATIPLVWSLSMVVHAGAHSSNFDENTDGCQVIVNVIAYQWGWNYFLPLDLIQPTEEATYSDLVDLTAYLIRQRADQVQEEVARLTDSLINCSAGYLSDPLIPEIQPSRRWFRGGQSCPTPQSLSILKELYTRRLTPASLAIDEELDWGEGRPFSPLLNAWSNLAQDFNFGFTRAAQDPLHIRVRMAPYSPSLDVDLDFFGGEEPGVDIVATRSVFSDDPVFRSLSNRRLEGIANHRFTVNSGLVLPTNTPLHIVCGSKDVIHSWAIPGLLIKIDCIPGFNSHRRLLIKWRGLFWGQCMEVCGRYHHWMPILLRTVHYDLFIVWLKSISGLYS